ncbi:MAG: hypothetical protein HY903_00325 [Deltaproteobacteria bacterium]|nr:hypothetical protein [Deltaproteobacteria bacterium]
MLSVWLALAALSPPPEVIAGCSGEGGGLRAVVRGVAVAAVGERLLLGQDELRLEVSPDETGSTPLAAGRDRAGDALAIVADNGGWTLRLKDGDVPLSLPPMLRPTPRLVLLGQSVRRVWWGGDDLLVMADLESRTVKAARLWRARGVPFAMRVGDEAEVAVGAEVLRCTEPRRCERRGRLSGPVTAVAGGDRGLLVALGGREPGVYRMTGDAAETSVPLVRGEVVALCGGDGGVQWAVMARGEDWRFVAASGATPAVRILSVPEVLAAAFLETPVPDLTMSVRILEMAAGEQWAQGSAIGRAALADRRPAVRAAAAPLFAARDTSAAVSALWLLGHDADVDVRAAALGVATDHCAPRTRAPCWAVLVWFFDDPDREVDADARDAVLAEDPVRALAGAAVGYRRQAVATLLSRAERHGGRNIRRGLEILAKDADSGVREAAERALELVTP